MGGAGENAQGVDGHDRINDGFLAGGLSKDKWISQVAFTSLGAEKLGENYTLQYGDRAENEAKVTSEDRVKKIDSEVKEPMTNYVSSYRIPKIERKSTGKGCQIETRKVPTMGLWGLSGSNTNF